MPLRQPWQGHKGGLKEPLIMLGSRGKTCSSLQVTVGHLLNAVSRVSSSRNRRPPTPCLLRHALHVKARGPKLGQLAGARALHSLQFLHHSPFATPKPLRSTDASASEFSQKHQSAKPTAVRTTAVPHVHDMLHSMDSS